MSAMHMDSTVWCTQAFEDVALVARVGLAAQRLAGLDEIVEPALPFGQVGALALGNAMRNPV
jgi:hypothetical protein